MTKVAFVTDVRYWHRKTGAQQRIYALAKYLRQQGHEVMTIFAAPISHSPMDSDRDLISATGIEVVSLIDDWHPLGLAGNLRWRASCIWNALTPKSKKSHVVVSKRLVEFESKLLKKRFAAVVQQIKPDVVIVEYLTLSYLVPPAGDRQGVLYAVDTHDLLSSRCQQFKNRGHQHWVEISEDEERRALAKFDVVIAIQPMEAELFRELVPTESPVVVAGHGVEYFGDNQNRQKKNGVSIGYFASNNAANVEALNWFLEFIWKEFAKSSPDTKFVVAGTVCDSRSSDHANVELLGSVDNPKEFYQRVDVVVNPVQFGTGLKIKNLEALAFGKPLIMAVPSAVGMHDNQTDNVPWLVAESSQQMTRLLLQICNDRDLRKRMSEAAERYVKTELNAQMVYSDLIVALEKK